MNKVLAAKLLVQIDFKTNEALTEYANDRINTLNSVLHNSSDINQVKRTQGEIEALKQLINIRANAQLVLDGDNSG